MRLLNFLAPMNKWSVIIPVCLLNQDLKDKYEKAYTSIGPFVHEVIVIENGSKELKQSDTIAWFKEPIGYAKAVNVGLAKATGDFVLILNSDAVIDTWDWVSRLTMRFLSDEKIGVIIPYLKNDGEPNHTAQIVGPCWALRREVLDKVGHLSVEYGAGYFDDNDYFMMTQVASYKVVSEEGVKVTHAGQSTFKVLYTEDEIKKLSATNYDKFTNKWHRFPVLD